MSSSRSVSPPEARVVRAGSTQVHEMPLVSDLPSGRMGQPIPFEVARSMQRGFNQGYEEGYGQGYADGVRQGKREGAEVAAAAQAELDARAAAFDREVAARRAELDQAAREQALEAGRRLRGALDELDRARAELEAAAADLARRDAIVLEDVQQQMLDLAFAVAESLVQHELEAAVDPGRDALLRAVALLPDRGDAVARLHPADLAYLTDVADLLPGRELALVADPEVERGGCVVDVGPARVDTQLTPALERVRQALGASRLVPPSPLLKDDPAALAEAAAPALKRARKPAAKKPSS